MTYELPSKLKADPSDVTLFLNLKGADIRGMMILKLKREFSATVCIEITDYLSSKRLALSEDSQLNPFVLRQ
jgi:hypothetical protein